MLRRDWRIVNFRTNGFEFGASSLKIPEASFHDIDGRGRNSEHLKLHLLHQLMDMKAQCLFLFDENRLLNLNWEVKDFKREKEEDESSTSSTQCSGILIIRNYPIIL